jgi:hypothetical protein
VWGRGGGELTAQAVERSNGAQCISECVLCNKVPAEEYARAKNLQKASSGFVIF